MTKQEKIALIGSNCVQCLFESMYEKTSEEYNAIIGVRQGQYDDEENTLIFVIVNPETRNFWEIRVEDKEWYNPKKAKEEEPDEDVMFTLETYLREIVFERIRAETEYDC